jgi:YVTN family beta-propeller protein
VRIGRCIKRNNPILLLSPILMAMSIIISHQIAAMADENTKESTYATTGVEQDKNKPENTGIKLNGNPYSVAVNTNSNTIYVVDKFYKKVSFIDGNNDELTRIVTIPTSKTPALSKYNLTDISSAIALDSDLNLLYVTNSGSDIVSVIDGSEGNSVINQTVDGSPRAIEIESTGEIFVLTNKMKDYKGQIPSLNNTVYRINGFFNRIDDDITTPDIGFLVAMDFDPNVNALYMVGEGQNSTIYTIESFGTEVKLSNNITLNKRDPFNTDIAVNPVTNKIYVVDMNGRIEVVKSFGQPYVYNYQTIAEVGLDSSARSIAVNQKTNKAYVTSLPNLLYVIDGSTDTVIKRITVGQFPYSVAVNQETNMIYVANLNSRTISVINGSSDEVTVGVTFKANPSDSGIIICNNQRISENYTRYEIGTSLRCTAQANQGFQFSSWSSDFELMNPPSVFTVFDLINFYLFGSLSSDTNDTHTDNIYNNPFTEFRVSQYGSLNANFITSTSIPAEFWTPLYGLIPGFFIPSIIAWLAGRRQRKYVRKSLEYIGKMDRSTIEKTITTLYTEGKISNSHYQTLKDRISDYYEHHK